MASGTMPEEDMVFGVRLEEQDTSGYQPRIRNMGKMERSKITGFGRTQPIVLYGLCEATVHGTDSHGTPCSLIVFYWNVHQRQRGKRFKSLRITVNFATTRTHPDSRARDAFYDPSVRALAPHGACSLLPTMVRVDTRASIEGSLQAGLWGAEAGVKAGYELSQSREATYRIVFNGQPCVRHHGEDPADPDRCNAVEWNLFENDDQKSGLPTAFRTAVLLGRRPGDNSQFTAAFDVVAEVGLWKDAAAAVKSLLGMIPKDDAVIFDPTVTEQSPFARNAGKLDTVPLDGVCKFVMYKEPI